METSLSGKNTLPEIFTEDLTFQETRANMDAGNPNLNLDNCIGSLPTVQAYREFKSDNGCHVKIFFSDKHDPGIRKEVARLLLAAFEQERKAEDEASNVSVQSFN